MFDIEKIEINAAFYELFESVFGEDFFTVLASIRPSGRIQALRTRATKIVKEEDEETHEIVEKTKMDLSLLDDSEQKEVVDYNLQVGLKTKKYTSRIAYIGSLLFKKKYNGSMNDYYSWLASFDASVFNDPEITKQIWEKIRLDQKVPDSAKNA